MVVNALPPAFLLDDAPQNHFSPGGEHRQCLRVQWPGNARVNAKHQSHPLFELSGPPCP